MNGVTRPVSGLTVTMRELLLLPLVRRLWLESDANSRPPWKPLSNAISIAGPCGWKTPVPPVTVVASVGLPRGPAIFLPLWSNTRMSGVKGLGADGCAVWNATSSLQILGRPCPDSSTKTSNFFALPRKATAVGAFSPLAKTDTVKPEGTMMSSPLPGSKKTFSPEQSGFVTSAMTRPGRKSSNPSARVGSSQRIRAVLAGCGIDLTPCLERAISPRSWRGDVRQPRAAAELAERVTRRGQGAERHETRGTRRARSTTTSSWRVASSPLLLSGGTAQRREPICSRARGSSRPKRRHFREAVVTTWLRAQGVVVVPSMSREPDARCRKSAGTSRPTSVYARRMASTFGLKIVLRLPRAHSFELRGPSAEPWKRGITRSRAIRPSARGVAEFAAPEERGDRAAEVVEPDGLHEVSGEAVHLHRRVASWEGGHRDGGDRASRVVRARAQPLEELRPRAIGQHEIADDEIGRDGLERRPGLGDGDGGDGARAADPERGVEQLEKVRVVVDDEDAGAAQRWQCSGVEHRPRPYVRRRATASSTRCAT